MGLIPKLRFHVRPNLGCYGRTKHGTHAGRRGQELLKIGWWRDVPPVQLSFIIKVSIDIRQLGSGNFLRAIAFPEDNLTLLFRSSVCHVVCNLVDSPRNIPIGYRLFDSRFQALHILQRPIRSMPSRLLVDSCCKPDDKLAIPEHPHRVAEIGAGWEQASQHGQSIP